MGIKERFFVEEITHALANEWAVKYHYLHRKPPNSFSFGLFDKDNLDKDGKPQMVGFIIYGTPSSAPLRKGICGIEEAKNVIELNRLYVHDDTPKNTESFFVSQTMRKVNKEIIISYADSGEKHTGIIYQALSWLYTGLSAKVRDLKIPGDDRHGQSIYDKYKAAELKAMGAVYVERTRKHRYIYFNAPKKKRKQLMKKLKYKVLPYPCNENNKLYVKE